MRWLAVPVLILAAYLAVSKIPLLFTPTSTPAPGTTPAAGALLAVGLAVTIMSAGIVYIALGKSANGSFPKLALGLVIAYNGLIVLVKFVLGPPGVWLRTYAVNTYDNPPPAVYPSSASGQAGNTAALEAVGLFLLYAAALVILFVFYRRRVSSQLRRLGSGRASRRFMAIPLASVFIFAGSLIFVGWFAAPFLSGDPYIRSLFSGASGVLAAVMLAGAITAASAAFQLTSERAVLVRDASLVTTIFWLGLALLAVYHVLWVVYIVTLLAIWPVKFTLVSYK